MSRSPFFEYYLLSSCFWEDLKRHIGRNYCIVNDADDLVVEKGSSVYSIRDTKSVSSTIIIFSGEGTLTFDKAVHFVNSGSKFRCHGPLEKVSSLGSGVFHFVTDTYSVNFEETALDSIVDQKKL